MTYPVMMHPVYEIFNDKLMATSWFQKLCLSPQLMKKLIQMRVFSATTPLEALEITRK